jgi:hypothetical protein
MGIKHSFPCGRILVSARTERVRADATTRLRGHGTSARTQKCVRVDARTRLHGRTHSLPPLPSPSLPSPLSCGRSLLFVRTWGYVHTDGRIFYFLYFINFFYNFFFGSCCRLGKREIYNLQFTIFGFQSPKSPNSPNSPNSPSSAGFVGEAVRRRRFFQPSSPSHLSKLYSSLGWLNSKVPKPFPPFSLRLIDVDGF